VCVCVCARACIRVCACVRVHARARTKHAHACTRALQCTRAVAATCMSDTMRQEAWDVGGCARGRGGAHSLLRLTTVVGGSPTQRSSSHGSPAPYAVSSKPPTPPRPHWVECTPGRARCTHLDHPPEHKLATAHAHGLAAPHPRPTHLDVREVKLIHDDPDALQLRLLEVPQLTLDGLAAGLHARLPAYQG